MLERLDKANKTLEAALDSYMKTCQDIYDIYVAGKPINRIPRDIAIDLTKQLLAIDLFKKKLELIQSVAGRCSNASPLLVPVHILPLEILARIFQLLIGDNCTDRPAIWALNPPNLQTLMRTCDRWRQVIINSPFLWTHIDLKVECGYTTLPRVNYAKLCVKRVAQMPLDVHIIDLSSSEPPEHSIRTSLVSFITSVAPRVRSFVFHLNDLIPNVHSLAAFFDNCSPGILTSLQLGLERPQDRNLVLLDAETGVYERVLSAHLSEERFEEIFQGVIALQLDFIHPTRRWTSSAYHGLVELRLTSWVSQVTESQFVGILKQSPGLRILECATSFDDPLEKGIPVDPIPLFDLEVINLGRNESPVVEDIVRWLGPGVKPLQLLLISPTSFEACLSAFISRSNITRFYCRQRELMRVMYFVHHLPDLKTLVLGYDWLGVRDKNIESKVAVKGKVSSSLETLYVTDLNCFNLKRLHKAFSLESLRRVVFYRCSPAERLEEIVLKIPVTTRSRIEFVIVPKDDPNPVGEWELFSRRIYDE
ncbi:hypothetical protein ACGC1H_001056 [Rhizoctonia solani]